MKPENKNILLRNIDKEAYKQIKILSIQLGLSIADTLKYLIDFYNKTSK